MPQVITCGQKYQTIAFDITKDDIENYRKKIDLNGEVDEGRFAAAKHLQFTAVTQDLSLADCIIVAVPIPFDSANKPDMRPLRSVFRATVEHMKTGAIVIFEFTVFPGVTEDVCILIDELW